MKNSHEIILGIDPGSNHTGFGLIKAEGEKLHLISQGRLSPSAAWPLERRLAFIYQGLYDLTNHHRPYAVAVEDIFHGLNARAALRLGHARGVALLVAAQLGAPVYEYAPILVKSTVAGYGRAAKTQVAHMVKELLTLTGDLAVDASDALAVAICHASQNRLEKLLPKGTKKTGGGSWRNLDAAALEALNYKK